MTRNSIGCPRRPKGDGEADVGHEVSQDPEHRGAGDGLVASGRLDAFVAPYANLRSFDCLPSLFLVLEAGGVVDLERSELDRIPLDGSVRIQYITAANAELLRLIQSKLR